MLLTSPVPASSHNHSTSHAHSSSSPSSIMSGGASTSTSRSVLRRYQHHMPEQPPNAGSHTHTRPPAHPGHHSSSVAPPAAPGTVPSGLVRMRLSQYLALCEANHPHNEPSRVPHSSKHTTASLPVSPRLQTLSSPSSPRPHPHSNAAPVSPLSYSSTSHGSHTSPASTLSSVSAIIAALHSHAQRQSSASTLSAQQQLAVAGRVRSLTNAYNERQRQQQLEREREKDRERVRSRQRSSQRAAHQQNKRPLPSTHNSVLAAVPNSRISLRRRHSDPRMSPPPPRAPSHTANLSSQPSHTYRTFPRSSLSRSTQPSSQHRPSRSQPATRVRFRRSCLVRHYSRCQAGSSGVPRTGAVSLGLDWLVVKQSSVRLRRDNARAEAEDETEQHEEHRVSRHYPSQNVHDELPRLTERERREALGVGVAVGSEDEVGQGRDDLVRERLELDEIRKSRQSNFCNCRPTRLTRQEELEAEDDDTVHAQPQCCTDLSCPCVRDGIGCHVEGNHYCQCNLSSSSARPPSCANTYGLFQFDEYSVRQHALDILYPSYEAHSINRSHSREDSANLLTPSSVSPSLSSPSSGLRQGGMPSLRSASFSFHPSGAPLSLLSSWSYSAASGGSSSGGWWDMSGSGTHTPRALLRRASRVSPPSSPLFVQSGRSSTAADAHKATG